MARILSETGLTPAAHLTCVGASRSEVDAVARRFGAEISRAPEVVDYSLYVGLASPMDFNGLVRHYYLRKGPNLADIRINLADGSASAKVS